MCLKGSEFKGENSCLDIVLLNCGCDCLGSCCVCCYSVELALQSHFYIEHTKLILVCVFQNHS